MNKKAQVWIETVIYTLIALALIGLVLAFASPKINKEKDRAVVEQAIGSLNDIDSKLSDSLIAPGNRRIAIITMKRGELTINGIDNTLSFAITDLSEPYSESGVPITLGRIQALSIKGQKYSSVNLLLNYTSEVDISVGGKDDIKKLTPSSTPYELSLLYNGTSVDINEAAGR